MNPIVKIEVTGGTVRTVISNIPGLYVVIEDDDLDFEPGFELELDKDLEKKYLNLTQEESG